VGGAKLKSEYLTTDNEEEDTTIDVPAELGYLNDCQQKLNDSN
jgi:hypothetical protein